VVNDKDDRSNSWVMFPAQNKCQNAAVLNCGFAFCETDNAMPIEAVIDSKILVVHAAISSDLRGVRDFRALRHAM
jgi:hypothetical protein